MIKRIVIQLKSTEQNLSECIHHFLQQRINLKSNPAKIEWMDIDRVGQ